MLMAGIYIHFPFCKRICSYCDFYKSTTTALIPDYIEALCLELSSRKDYLQNEIIETIYFGGGTPSLFTIKQLDKIIDTINNLYLLASHPEITLEANPDDLTPQFLHDLSHTPVNRLSIGIQSLFDKHLNFLNRRHDSAKSVESIESARRNGFNNISIDLIYGIPGMNNNEWLKTLNTIPEVEHISAYHLTIEPGTALYRKVSAGLLSIPPEDDSAIQFHMLREFADQKRMIHYEISNIAKEGFFSRHNTAYWKRKRYLGAGPSAHSYDMKSRQWNVRDVKKYISNIQKGEQYFEREVLTEGDNFNEYLMVSLRTIWGADEHFILEEFGESFLNGMHSVVKPFIKSGHLICDKGIYKMTPSGWLISDHILARLISG